MASNMQLLKGNFMVRRMDKKEGGEGWLSHEKVILDMVTLDTAS